MDSLSAAVIGQYAALANIGRMAEQRFEALEELTGLLEPGNKMTLERAVGYVQGRRGLSHIGAEALKKAYVNKELDKFNQSG